jgi:hypothetical protein
MSGRVSGSVVDATGAPIPAADVSLYLMGGSKPLLKTKSATDGTYNMIGIRPAQYDLTVEAAGFVKSTVHGITVDAARETDIPRVKLELASVTFKVDVNAAEVPVDTANAEINTTVTMAEMQNLPILDRDVLGVLQLKAGVTSGNSTTTINGLRTSYSDMTMDGVNIQDNYIRDNALDYSPNKPKLGQVSQMTLVTSNANAAASGGATEAAFSTPSGTNQTHGEVFWMNRNNKFAANDWFNNQAGIDKPFLNQNQFGGDLAGHIRKDKLFYYVSYEGLRAHQQLPQNPTVLTAAARAGNFTYNSGGTLRTVNLLTLRNLTGVDSGIQPLLAQVPTTINNSEVGDGRNTGGYRFNQRDNFLQDNIGGRLDYNMSTSQAFSGSFQHNRFNADRADYSNNYGLVPAITNPTHSDLLALSWRWTPSGTLTNELRGGFNRTYQYFLSSATNVPYILTGTIFTDPVNEMQPQGRTTNTYTISDDASWQHGRHYVQFGFFFQKIGVESHDAAGTIPTFNLFLGSGQPAVVLTRRDLTGISSADLATANALLATLGGYIDSYSQTFNITSRTSGFVNGAAYLRHLMLNNYAFYVQDRFKVAPRLTLNIGLRYQLPGVVDERDSLELSPVLKNTQVDTLLSNATLNFAGASAGRPWYNREYKEFGPNIGFAWDVFGNGRTAFRGGYALTYVNDQAVLAPESLLAFNNGIRSIAADNGFSNRVSTGLPLIVPPTYKVPRTFADNFALDPFANAEGMIDPNLRRPHVQQYSIGIQHEIKGTVLEARYVGNHTVGGYRAFDFNQVQLQQNGWLADFLRAQNNGFLAQKATGTFNPVYNPNISGSQPLQLFGKLAKGALQDGNALGYLQTGEVGELAYYYQANRYNDSHAVTFFQNPNTYGADLLTNYSSASYNSLQLEAHRRLKSGLSLEGNYTFSKVLSDADGDVQNRLQHFLDINNPRIERSRANFDLTHMIKANGYYELPFGKGHRLLAGNGIVSRIAGGWTIGSTMVWQSGAPFSITSGRGTFNRESRSAYNDANTTLTGSQLGSIVKFQMTGNGPMMIAQSGINPDDGTGVNVDGAAPFKGQVFFNPPAGTIGTLQRRMFDGPWTFDLDAKIRKEILLSEGKHLELNMIAVNCLNHATFWSGDQNINSTTFGVVSSMFYAPRVVEFGMRLSF